MRQGRDVGEQRRLDILAGDEKLYRLDPGGRLNQVLTFRDEELQLVTPAPVVELADELEPLVVAGGDQA